LFFAFLVQKHEGMGRGRLVTEHSSMLDVDNFQKAVEESFDEFVCLFFALFVPKHEGIGRGRLVTEHPSMLDVDNFEKAVEESKRLLPGLDVCQTMDQNPALIFRFQRGSQLIPYDEPGSDG
jgi:hypothetical protein